MSAIYLSDDTGLKETGASGTVVRDQEQGVT